jgi:phenylalanyl-tRNA synthetase alpha chain
VTGQSITAGSLEQLHRDALAELKAVSDERSAEAFRVKYLGKKGLVRSILRGLKDVPAEQRRELGGRANELSRKLEELYGQKPWEGGGTAAPDAPSFDHTLPGYPLPRGGLHPLTLVHNQIRDIFVSMGFDVAYGPDVETDHYNFEALNFPADHPARDMQDTFLVSEQVLLRTHTSPVQIRVMQKQKPPIRCIMPGRCYRHEEISARSHCLFHQIEGLYVDENVTFMDLKGTLLAFCRRFFEENTEIKIRPSFFPFTEPSVEVDVRCFLCRGEGCSVCKSTGWLEILGAGMVHPNVLRNGGIDPERYTGFAFGMGLERPAMLKHGVDDIRLFFENDVRFLNQFA